MPPPRQAKQSESRTIISENSTFRFNCERYYLIRGADKAFTLAEVLVTLGIIGVVSALTIPSLISRHQKQTSITQLKTAYSILYNAFNMAVLDHGEIDNWSMLQEELGAKSSEEFVKAYLQPYIKNVEVYHSDHLVNCKNITYRNMDGSIARCNSVKGFCETCLSGGGGTNMSQLHMANGMIIVVLTRYNEYAEIFIDTNGYKGPNTWGKDVFKLELRKPSLASKSCSQYSLSVPFGNICHSRDWHIENGCNKNSQTECGSIIIYDNWQMKEDYPWK